MAAASSTNLNYMVNIYHLDHMTSLQANTVIACGLVYCGYVDSSAGVRGHVRIHGIYTNFHVAVQSGKGILTYPNSSRTSQIT